MEKLTDEMLENVTGGFAFHEKEDEYGQRFCKYCWTFLPYESLGIKPAWDSERGLILNCEVCRCNSCHKDTYWYGFGYLT